VWALFHVKQLPWRTWPPRRPNISRPRRLLALIMAFAFAGTAAACYALPSPQGWADPVVDGNTIFYSPTAGKLVAYDRLAQKVIWDFPGSQNKNLKLEAIYSTPILDAQSLYFAAYDGSIYALNRGTGQLQWEQKTGSPMIGGLLLKDGVLYAGNSDGHVLALHATDGSKTWQQQAGRRVWSTPVDANGLIIVTSMDSEVYAFNPRGSLVWKSTAASAAIASSPGVSADRITFGGFDKRFHSIEEATGTRIWVTPAAGNWFWTQGLISGDNLYAGNLDGNVYAYDATSGSLKWHTDLGSPIRSAPVLVGGALVVATKSGMIHGLDPISGAEKWPPIDAGAGIFANLVPSQSGSVYAVTQPGTKNGAHLFEINPTTGSSTTVIAP
jgi:outer membrane protein assembly factor BamB